MTEIDTGYGAPSSDDEFEALARRAMGELKRPAPERGMDAVRSRGQRRQAAGVVLKVVGTVAVLVLGGVLIAKAGSDEGDKAPATPVTTGVPATTAGPATTAAPPDTTPVPLGTGEGWLAVAQTGATRTDVHLVRPDGTGAHSLTEGIPGFSVDQPDWSPDGKRLVVTVGGNGAVDLWTIGADRSSPEMLVDCFDPCRYVTGAAWSPDGRSVAYERAVLDADGTQQGTLEIVDVETKQVRVLLTAPAAQLYRAPRWSPDGTRLVFVVFGPLTAKPDSPELGAALAVVSVARPGTALRRITDAALGATYADWSPTDDLIVYSSEIDGEPGRDLFTIHPDGTGSTRLTHFADDNAIAETPTFTPDGQQVLFVYRTATTFVTFVASVDLSGTPVATGGPAPLPSWIVRLRPGTALS